MIVFIEVCAEKAGITCERYDLKNKLGSIILDRLGVPDSKKNGGTSSTSEKIGRNSNHWLQESLESYKNKPHESRHVKEQTFKLSMNFIGVQSWDDFRRKFAKRIAQKEESLRKQSSKQIASKPDRKYKRVARFYPAMLCLLPVIIIAPFVSFNFLSIKYWFIIVGLLAILWLFLAEWLYRSFVSNSKKYENELFNERMMFPTTELLLRENTFYSKSFKGKFSNKTKKEFDLELPSLEMEQTNLAEAIAEINSVIAFVKGKMINHKMILNHNISYGFVRNLIGGVPVAIISSGLGVIIGLAFGSVPLILTESIFLIGFMVFWRKRKDQLTSAAFAYARQLIDEYIRS